MKIRHAANPTDARHYTTDRLRSDFLIEQVMVANQINLVYTHYDRVVTGGVVPGSAAIALETHDCLKASYFLERRELGIINIGGAGVVKVNGERYDLEKLACLYVGMGQEQVSFESADAGNPAKFFLMSAPAHTGYPTQKFTKADASPVELGSLETSNHRTIYKYIHGGGIKSCQLVMGLTVLKPGSIWNTMPSHVHDRRMEVYLYFEMPENARIIHLMGEPGETRHLVVANEQAIISPPWSIHSGAGTSNYSFIWAMAGENQDFTDMDFIEMNNLR